jgi:L-threonylcarbamoyladenylate synthase
LQGRKHINQQGTLLESRPTVTVSCRKSAQKMKTSIISIDAGTPQEKKIKETANILRRGGIVAIPTETVFGLACDLANVEAIKRLYTIKKRPEDKPFTIQVASIDKVLDFIDRLNPVIEKALNRFWPGPLTVIIDSKKGKKGFRIPDNKVALALLSEIGRPLAVTSANASEESALISVKDVTRCFSGLIDAIIDDGNRASGIESTILDCTVTPFKILRKGAIADKLKQYIKI